MERHQPAKTLQSNVSRVSPQDSAKIHTYYDLSQVDIFRSEKKILHQLTFKIQKGDFIFLTGHTGAGKTTLLNFLSGEISQYHGTVISTVLNPGSDIFVSRIFQDLKLFPELSVKENLGFSYDAKIYQSYEQYRQELGEYIKIMGLKDYMDQKLSVLSGGLKQKVAIIRSLLSRPEVLLADEPTSNLDRTSTLQLFEILNYLNIKRKMTVVWATHNHELIKQFHGKLISLEKGRMFMQHQGTP